MLYLLLNENKQAAWQEPYETLYIRELEASHYPYQKITRTELGKVKPSDFVWVMHYKDLQLVKDIDCHVISQVNGTSANPYIHQVDPEQERKDMEIIDIALVFSERQRVAMKRLYPNTHYIVAGFPVEVDKTIVTNKIPKTIVVPGRISPDKQFYLSTYILQDLLSEGYSVTFAIPEDSDSDFWLTFYKQENFERMGFKFKTMNREFFLKELAQTQIVFLASLGDICSVSLAEALMLGCYPVVPNFGKNLPTYDEYVSMGYTPFNKDSALSLIRNSDHTSISFNYLSFIPSECMRRLNLGLGEYIATHFVKGVYKHESSI